MLATGMRVGDACTLGYDPIVRDRDDNPYIRYWNHKMRREAFVPISPATLDKIREQQARVRHQYPAHTTAYLSRPAPQNLPVNGLRLVPANKRNGDGARRSSAAPTTCSYRHGSRSAASPTKPAVPPTSPPTSGGTFATTVVNRGVRLEVVKQLLDHASLEMASHYARLLDTIIRAEWDAGHFACRP
jgi:integrase